MFGTVTRVYQAAATAQSIASATATTVVLDTVDFDPQGNFDVSTYTYTAPSAGYYVIIANLQYKNGAISPGTSSNAFVAILNNGTQISLSGNFTMSSSYNGKGVSAMVLLAAGDKITLQTEQYSGAAQPLNGEPQTWMSVAKLGDTSGSLATQPAAPTTQAVVSGTVYQNTNAYNIVITVPVSWSAAGTWQFALGPTSAPGAWGGAATGAIGTDNLTLIVPAGWYWSLTITGTATIGTASVRGE